MKHLLKSCALLALLLTLPGTPSRAVTPPSVETILHRFQGSKPGLEKEGIQPIVAPIQGKDGNFYGTTSSGGTEGLGTVYKLTPAGAVTTLHNFGEIANDGFYPATKLVQASDGNFYGTTGNGVFEQGIQRAIFGTVYKITPAGVYTVLHRFDAGADGNDPQGGVIEGKDGNLYGTTSTAPTPAKSGSTGGTVFKITKTGVLTVLHSFGQGNPHGLNALNDGEGPYAELVQAGNGDFYGITLHGGTHRLGEIYRITPAGGFTILHSFGTTPQDGEDPVGLIQGADGNFYGRTLVGTIFRVTPAGKLTPLINLASFGPSNSGIVQGPNGDFYGVESRSVFQYNADTNVLSDIYVYPGTSDLDLDGRNPDFTGDLVVAADGSFYGAQIHGGLEQKGVIFQVTTSGGYKEVHAFQGPAQYPDGAAPTASLIEGTDGYLYGTTTDGGDITYGPAYRMTGNDGTITYGMVFKTSPTGKTTVLHSFNFDDGANPSGRLLQAKDGNFYGTTYTGGTVAPVGYPYGYGTVFKITKSGHFTVLHNFGDGTVPNDGRYPRWGFVQGTSGYLYGVAATENSGTTVFRISTTGVFTVLHSFAEGIPSSGLTLGPDGSFYGSMTHTIFGSDDLFHYTGILYKITPSGTGTVLHTIANTQPAGDLLLGPDGLLYGTTIDGGTAHAGSIYDLNPAGGYKNLYSFGRGTSPTRALSPSSGLTLGKDGSFYGSTSGGGTGSGTIFEMTPTGTVTVLHQFGDGTVADDGIDPAGGLLQAKNGLFYGTTQKGGSINDGGTVFSFGPGKVLPPTGPDGG